MSSPQALQGLTVVEIGTVAAAYAAKLLADFGAHVVKLESDEAAQAARSQLPFVEDTDGAGRSAMFRYLNTNKWSAPGEMPTSELEGLLEDADVFLSDRPLSELEDLGLGIARLRERHPHLLVTTITPFGTSGPHAVHRGGELVTYAMGGLAHATPGLPDAVRHHDREPPLHPGGHPGGMAAGLAAVVAILSALPADGADGSAGQHLDVSQQAAVACLIYRNLAVTSYDGGDVGRRYPGPLNMPNYYLPCRDAHVAIAAPQQVQWERLVLALGRPEWAVEERFATVAERNRNREALQACLEEWCQDRGADDVVALAQEHGIPCFRFYSLEQMEESAHVAERRSLVAVPGTTTRARMPGAPFRMSATPWVLRKPAPRRGERGPRAAGSTAPPRRPPSGPAEPDRAPLAGVRVLDFGQVLALPFATQWMAWLGAEVILVESTRHLHTRVTPPFAGGCDDPNLSGVFNTFNASKKSLTVDLKDPRGRALILRLVGHCDIVLENFRTGVMERLGFSYAQLRAARPDLIMLSLGAFGRSGPLKDGAGLHSAANLFSGLADVTRYPEGHPRIMGACLPDPLSGLYALIAVLMALRHRGRTGDGQHIDQAMYEALLPLCAAAIMGDASARQQARTGRGASQHGVVLRARGVDEWLAVELQTVADWEAARSVVSHPSLGSSRPNPEDAATEFEDELRAWAVQRTKERAVDELRSAGLAAGPAQTSSEVLADPQLAAIGFSRQVDHRDAGTRTVPGLPWRAERWEADIRPPPLLGEHVDELLGDLLGMGDDDIDALRREGILR